MKIPGFAAILLLSISTTSFAETFNVLQVNQNAVIGTTLQVNQSITALNTVTAPYLQANTRLYTPGYLQVTGYSYLGGYAGDFALRVSNTDGAVIMKKAQGDILMGQFGN